LSTIQYTVLFCFTVGYINGLLMLSLLHNLVTVSTCNKEKLMHTVLATLLITVHLYPSISSICTTISTTNSHNGVIGVSNY